LQYYRYFTSLKTGALQRRSTDLSVPKITDALMRKKDMSSDISCVYVGCAKGESQPITEYLSPAGLDYFLSSTVSTQTRAGLVQNFIHPKGASNFLIRVSWTPDECTMDNLININRLDDQKFDIQERAATNDKANCVLLPMNGNLLMDQLKLLCLCIVEHIQSTASPPVLIEAIVLNFNIDLQDRVWLLWCEQLHYKLDDHMSDVGQSDSDDGQFDGDNAKGDEIAQVRGGAGVTGGPKEADQEVKAQVLKLDSPLSSSLGREFPTNTGNGGGMLLMPAAGKSGSSSSKASSNQSSRVSSAGSNASNKRAGAAKGGKGKDSGGEQCLQCAKMHVK